MVVDVICFAIYFLLFNELLRVIRRESANDNNADTIKEAYLMDVAIPTSYNLHSTITVKLQKYTDMKEELIRLWQLKTAYVIALVLSTVRIILNKLQKSLKLLYVCPALYMLMQKAIILNTCHRHS